MTGIATGFMDSFQAKILTRLWKENIDEFQKRHAV